MTFISLLLGVFVSAVSIIEMADKIGYRNKQQAIEAQVKSHDLFLNRVLDRISGAKLQEYEPNENGQFVEVKRQTFGAATQKGAYAAAASLAKEFPTLKPVAIQALENQIHTDPLAKKYYDILNN